MMLTDDQLDNVKSYLGEGFHTAFRKGAPDSRVAGEIHDLIREIPADEWDAILDFVTKPVVDYVLELDSTNRKDQP